MRFSSRGLLHIVLNAENVPDSLEKGEGTISPELGVEGLRRSSLDILAEVLEASTGGVNKTRLLTACNLNSPQAGRYLEIALESELLIRENNGGRPQFRTSSKGRAFLQSYRLLESIVETRERRKW